MLMHNVIKFYDFGLATTTKNGREGNIYYYGSFILILIPENKKNPHHILLFVSWTGIC